MFRNLFLIAVVALASACDYDNNVAGPDDVGPRTGVSGSGNVVAEPREIGTFHRVSFNGVGHLSLERTGAASLTIVAEDNVQPFLVSEVVDGTLRLGVRSNTNLNDIQPIEFRLTAPALDALSVSGAATVDAMGVDTERLDVVVSGATSVTMAGRAGRQDVTITGASSYNATALPSRSAHIVAEGASSAIVRVSETLTGRVSGASSITYIGNPSVDVDGNPVFVRQQ